MMCNWSYKTISDTAVSQWTVKSKLECCSTRSSTASTAN